jgi:effector-binding domain-containing protein
MKIKEVRPINFLFFRTRTTVDQLEKFIPVGQQLFREAVDNSLPITGALQWHYHNFNIDPGIPFDFEIALPVGAIPEEYDGEFHVKRTEAFKCICTEHEGDWLAIPQTYCEILKFASEHNLSLNSSSREIYTNVDLQDPSANITEIQLGIQ